MFYFYTPWKLEFQGVWKWNTDLKWVNHLKRQHHKMVKHTQSIRWQKPANFLSVFEHFVGLALNGLIILHHTI